MVTCSDSKAVRSNRVPMGIAPGAYTSSRVSISGSSEPRGANLGDGSCHLGSRAISSGDTAPSGLDVGRWLGAGVLVGSSTLGIGDKVLSEDVGAMGPFLAPSNISISMLKRSPSSTMGSRYLWSSCTTLQNIFGETQAQMARF